MSLLYRRNYHVVCVTYTAMQLVDRNILVRRKLCIEVIWQVARRKQSVANLNYENREQ